MLQNTYDIHRNEKNRYKEILKRTAEDVVMYKAQIYEIKELMAQFKTSGRSSFINNYSLMTLGEKSYDSQCKVVKILDPLHALVSVSQKDGLQQG